MGFRITTLIWMASFAIATFGLYIVKYTAEALQRDVDVVQAEVKKEHESLHLLNAEWAYLNRPERLRSLAEAHLDMQPLDSRKVEEVRALPAAYETERTMPQPIPSPLYQPVSGSN